MSAVCQRKRLTLSRDVAFPSMTTSVQVLLKGITDELEEGKALLLTADADSWEFSGNSVAVTKGGAVVLVVMQDSMAAVFDPEAVTIGSTALKPAADAAHEAPTT
jgi:hypothetical protein